MKSDFSSSGPIEAKIKSIVETRRYQQQGVGRG